MLRKRTKGIILLTIGIYFVIINPVLSIIFNQVFYSYNIIIDPMNYWTTWFSNFGALTLIFIIIGAYMIRIGNIYIKLEKFSD